jgi:twitching motility protein PilT
LDIQQIIAGLRQKGASDLHLEPGLEATARIQGDLRSLGGDPLEAKVTRQMARELLSDPEWETLAARRSMDFSTVLGGVRCRVHILKSQRGIGLALRLLSSFQPTLERLNLHPDLARLVEKRHGLIVVSGPTGSGKSSTVAALIHEINQSESRHIVTLESPIEYTIAPRKSFIRQREVGRDTPSFERGLLDAMRQDPDVIVVGEMRERETMQLTLNAAETGQLVISTLHSANTSEAVQRMVSAFPPEIQGSVCNQIADSFIAFVAQRLTFNEAFGIRVPVCEILVSTHPVKNQIRQGQFFKLPSALETGHGEGNWTFRRYHDWLDKRTDFFVPSTVEALEAEPRRVEDPAGSKPLKAAPIPKEPAKSMEDPAKLDRPGEADPEDVIVIEEPEEKSLSELLKKIDKKKE